MTRWITAVGVAALVTLGTVGPVAAGVTTQVNVTNVTIDPVARLSTPGFNSATSASAHVSGTITCDGDGHIGWVSIDLYQGDLRVGDNLSLLDYPCTTEPTSWRVQTDAFGACTREARDTTCLHVGWATVVATDNSCACGTYPTWEQAIRLKKSK